MQEHVGLLRGLLVQFPEQYADMAHLLDKDPELDFFNNVAHLQLHRRQRALHRLTRVRPPSCLCSLSVAVPWSLVVAKTKHMHGLCACVAWHVSNGCTYKLFVQLSSNVILHNLLRFPATQCPGSLAAGSERVR